MPPRAVTPPPEGDPAEPGDDGWADDGEIDGVYAGAGLRRVAGRVRRGRGPGLSEASFQAIRDRRLARREALEVRLTFRLRTGPGADERLVLLDDRRLPLVGSVFERRDDILRAFALLMAKGLMLQPKLLRGAVPLLRLFRHLPVPGTSTRGRHGGRSAAPGRGRAR